MAKGVPGTSSRSRSLAGEMRGHPGGEFGLGEHRLTSSRLVAQQRQDIVICYTCSTPWLLQMLVRVPRRTSNATLMSYRLTPSSLCLSGGPDQ